MARHDKDKLVVQVAIETRLPPHVKVTKRVLDDILQRAINGEAIPPNVTIRGIFWRNPNRRGGLSDWRYHTGADLSAAPTDAPLESSPRGSLREALDTLAPFIGTGAITFR